MLIVETVARIRREHFVKGKTIREIARDLHVSRNTVRKVLRSGETSFEYERSIQPRPKFSLQDARSVRDIAMDAGYHAPDAFGRPAPGLSGDFSGSSFHGSKTDAPEGRASRTFRVTR